MTRAKPKRRKADAFERYLIKKHAICQKFMKKYTFEDNTLMHEGYRCGENILNEALDCYRIFKRKGRK